MKKAIAIAILVLGLHTHADAQLDQNIGAGYFGNTITYPGMVLEYGLEKMFSEKASIPVRFDLGFYHHKRYNTGVFADVNIGFRRYFGSGFFLEESIGVGILSTFVSSDNVYVVNADGTLSETSRYAATDFMPSITLGAGYDLTKKKASKNLVWVRPKIFWQVPHKTTAFYSVALQVGYSHYF